ncbi:hypothetical protein IFM89_019637 [Coptis chinensis]|uniref:F-box domain-containing protein n=1 Tax=Coptis chinensis TaxID=261450 RepID=A0A835LYS5_9MAGN|nr:hypothetical protein IFM89_019637 [Coptis chinensis]
MVRCVPTRRGVFLQSSDRLTGLPTELINNILTLVPIRDVVRTSALSRNWRYKWMYIPEIVFDSRSIPLFPPSASLQGQRNLVDFVTHVLSFHSGTLQKFGMSGYLESSCNDVDRWILLLSRKSVKMITLEFPQGNQYKVPSALFSIQTLEELKLKRSILKLPSHTIGFKNLVDLDLWKVTLTNETIASIIVDCPLEKLTLIYCDGFSCLNVCAPKLIMFFLYSPCGSIYFDNTPQLRIASIEMLPMMVGGIPLPRHLVTSRLDARLTGLVNVQELCIFKNFMKILAAHIIPERLCFTYHILTTMLLEMNFESLVENSTALCLFRSSPCLLTLHVTVSTSSVDDGSCDREFTGICVKLMSNFFHYLVFCRVIFLDSIPFLGNGRFWESIPHEEIIFARLNNLVLSGFMGMKNEVSFVQFVLRCAVMLHTIRITWDATVEKGTKRTGTLENMMQFRRASPRARVIFSG